MMTLTSFVDGLQFAECPRWHDGRLWFSDIFGQRVMRTDERGALDTVIQFSGDDLPAGLGFLPDGRLLVANMGPAHLLAVDSAGNAVCHADLTELAVGPLNDMVVDGNGFAYVGSNGVDSFDTPRPITGSGRILLVRPDGSSTVVADRLDAPNGPVLTKDGDTYIVAELPAKRLTAFTRSVDGGLSDRRVWADLAPGTADGIALDADGAVWTCSPALGQCRRVLEGGRITDVIDVPGKMPLACCLGGHDGQTLFVLSIIGVHASIRNRTTTSVIETTRVRVAGW